MKEIAIAVISLVIGAIVGPYINWGIEKRKQKLAYRRELLTNARKMIAEVARQRGTSGTLAELLERRQEFHAVKGFLSDIAVSEIFDSRTILVSSTIDAGLSVLADDLNKLERDWNLV